MLIWFCFKSLTLLTYDSTNWRPSYLCARDWLVRYKFKDWSKHSSTGNTVSKEEKTIRAEEVARALNDQERWGTHGRGINREVLVKLKLKIDNLESDTELSSLTKEYFWFFRDLAFKEESQSLVHNRLFI